MPLDEHFDKIRLDPYLRHREDKDGFEMLLRLRSNFAEDIKVTSIVVNLRNADGGQSNLLELRTVLHSTLSPGFCKVTVGSNVSTTTTHPHCEHLVIGLIRTCFRAGTQWILWRSMLGR